MQTPYSLLLRACALALASWLGLAAAAQNINGAPIPGVANGDRAGFSVALSADGRRVVVGSPLHVRQRSNYGEVRVFDLVNGNWQQVGADIEGISFDGRQGFAVDISDNGSRIVVGAPRTRPTTGGGIPIGSARVYDYNAALGQWQQVGNALVGNGTTIGEELGFAVAISGDGARIALGAPRARTFAAGGFFNDVGYVKVYTLSGGTWTQDDQLFGRLGFSRFGVSVDLDVDGDHLVVGASYISGERGEVAVYLRDANGRYNLKGAYEAGDGTDDFLGTGVAISGSGDRIIAGAPSTDANNANTGYAKVYAYNGSRYVPVGQTITGTGGGDDFGQSVDITADGLTVAIGAPGATDFRNVPTGSASTYDYLGTTWTLFGRRTGGGSSNLGEHGFDVALSGTRGSLAVGEPNDNFNRGAAEVYALTVPLPVELKSFTASAKTGPAADAPHVALAWTTATERGAAFFAVERSGDGEAWTTVAEVAAAGHTDTPTAYAYTDAAPLAGASYYRLRQVDHDGTEAFGPSAAVDLGVEIALLADARVFPNPASDYVEVHGLPADATAELRDLAGRRVGVAVPTPATRLGMTSFGDSRIDLAGVPAGVYALTLRSGGEAVTRRVVIE